MNKNYVIATIGEWNIKSFDKYYSKDSRFCLVQNTDELKEVLAQLKPHKVFFPHWSSIIPSEIFENYECIVFHMTDLPYGRGGSPLQNLIVNKVEETKISAIRVVEELDAGDIYLKEPLALRGSAKEIFENFSDIVFKNLIPKIIDGDYKLRKQEGEVVRFKRRKPEQSNIKNLTSLTEVYDYIRMLDAPSYPNAFLDFGNFRIQFSEANLKDKKLHAKILITERGNNGN